jgi:ADP-ribose pyrophosphatase YjhB (NUDIX family)
VWCGACVCAAGFVDPGEDFIEAAHRETIEEAGVKIKLLGVLRVEHSVKGAYGARMRVIFFAVPTDPDAPPKSKPDAESEGAAWMTVAELWAIREQLRGTELLEWGAYIDSGGHIAPLSFFTPEGLPAQLKPKQMAQ